MSVVHFILFIGIIATALVLTASVGFDSDNADFQLVEIDVTSQYKKSVG